VNAVHVHDCAPVGTYWSIPGANGDGIGQTEQSKFTFGGKVRSAPNVVTCAGAPRESTKRPATIGRSRIVPGYARGRGGVKETAEQETAGRVVPQFDSGGMR